MNFTIVYSPKIWPFILAALFLTFLFFYSLRRRQFPGALPFSLGCLFSLAMMASVVFEVLASTPSTKYFWFYTHAVMMIPTMTAITSFFLEYTWPGRWLTPRNLILLSLAPLLILVLILVNNTYAFLWELQIVDGWVVPEVHWAGWFFIIYAFIFSIINIIIFIWVLSRGPKRAWPLLIMLLGSILGRGIFLLNLIWQNPVLSSIPIEIIPFLGYSVSIFGYQIFAPIPLARRLAMEQALAAIIVVDHQDRIVYLNPAAKVLADSGFYQLQGDSLHHFLTQYQAGPSFSADNQEIEIVQSVDNQQHYYTISIAELWDWRGLSIGKLLTIQEVTHQREAQQKIIEQQRALASLEEREILARELHDSICQVLSYAGFQLDACVKLNDEGHFSQAIPQLERLSAIIHDTNIDLRNQIAALRTPQKSGTGIFEVIRGQLIEFSENYQIRSHLQIEDSLSEDMFTPDEQQQITRIIQESLTNIHKHARANNVVIAITRVDGRIHITLSDDGVGFDIHQYSTAEGPHFGLQFMKERAQIIGSELAISSKLNQGTQIILKIREREQG